MAKVANTEGGKSGEDPFSELKEEVRMACMRGGINLYTFAVAILPQARKHLDALRRGKVENLFKLRDLRGEGFISIESCAEIIRSISRDEKLRVESLEALIHSNKVI